MSRIGNTPVKITSGVKVDFKSPNLEVSGKEGKLTRYIPDTLKLDVKADEIVVSNISTDPSKKALHGLFRTLIDNMVKGVSEGFTKKLELQGVGYRAEAKGNAIKLLVGFSHPVQFELPQGIKAKVDGSTKITLNGADKELVGRIAAELRKVRPPEPYKGKGIRYAGEVVSLKQGKTAGK